MKFTLIFIALLMLGATSCRKKGCMDSEATNYYPEAKKDNGTCLYSSFVMFWHNIPTADSMNQHPLQNGERRVLYQIEDASTDYGSDDYIRAQFDLNSYVTGFNFAPDPLDENATIIEVRTNWEKGRFVEYYVYDGLWGISDGYFKSFEGQVYLENNKTSVVECSY